MSTPVYAFACNVVGAPWPDRIVNAHSRGTAKADYWRDLRDAWPDTPYTSIRARKVGAPRDPGGLARTAAYRGLPGARAGDRVRVGDGLGVIVGSNSSANFDVLFDLDSPAWAGQTLNCHPQSHEFELLPKGNLP